MNWKELPQYKKDNYLDAARYFLRELYVKYSTKEYGLAVDDKKLLEEAAQEIYERFPDK